MWRYMTQETGLRWLGDFLGLNKDKGSNVTKAVASPPAPQQRPSGSGEFGINTSSKHDAQSGGSNRGEKSFAARAIKPALEGTALGVGGYIGVRLADNAIQANKEAAAAAQANAEQGRTPAAILAGEVPTNTNAPATATATETPTPRPTETYTDVPTEEATNTPENTATNTKTPTNTETPEPTETSTRTPSNTKTLRPSRTPTDTRTPRPTRTETVAPTATPTRTPTETEEPTLLPTETEKPDDVVTNTPNTVPGETKVADTSNSNETSPDVVDTNVNFTEHVYSNEILTPSEVYVLNPTVPDGPLGVKYDENRAQEATTEANKVWNGADKQVAIGTYLATNQDNLDKKLGIGFREVIDQRRFVTAFNNGVIKVNGKEIGVLRIINPQTRVHYLLLIDPSILEGDFSVKFMAAESLKGLIRDKGRIQGFKGKGEQWVMNKLKAAPIGGEIAVQLPYQFNESLGPEAENVTDFYQDWNAAIDSSVAPPISTDVLTYQQMQPDTMQFIGSFEFWGLEPKGNK